MSPIIEDRFKFDPTRLDKVKKILKSMIGQLSILSYVFHEICHYLYLTVPLSTDELNSFEKLCSSFGELWRKFGLNVSPKVHIIESHLNDYMRRFGRLGMLTDDTMERTWTASHLWSRVYSCILNWEDRTGLIYSRLMSSQHSDVQTAANTGDVLTRESKRQKHGTELLSEHKTYSDVVEYINSLKDLQPLYDIFGTSYSDADADDMFDDIEAEIDEDIEHAAHSD